MSGDPLNYQSLTEDALRGVMRQALKIVAEQGLLGQHHFYLTFRTDLPGVRVADSLRQRHPKEMTIVLQHQYWGLEVTNESFTVTLSFNGQHERLHVPFLAVSAFVDPSVQFGLQFSVAEPASAPVTALPAEAPTGAPPPAPQPADKSEAAGSRVVALDAFRKPDTRKK